jgi:hypothetical protein
LHLAVHDLLRCVPGFQDHQISVHDKRDVSDVRVIKKPCPHGRRQAWECVDCKGGGSCQEHMKIKRMCRLCHELKQCATYCRHCAYRCEECGLFYVAKKTSDGMRLCAYCSPNSSLRQGVWSSDRAEVQAGRILGALLPSEEWIVTPVGTYPVFLECGDRPKPDIIIRHKPTNQWVVFEVDEHYHSRYDTSCEWKKVIAHFQSTL